MRQEPPWPRWLPHFVWLACSIVICCGILLIYCFMTNSWSIVVPQPKHAPVFQFCSDAGTFGNGCGWE